MLKREKEFLNCTCLHFLKLAFAKQSTLVLYGEQELHKRAQDKLKQTSLLLTGPGRRTQQAWRSYMWRSRQDPRRE